MYRGISNFKKGYYPRINIVKDEKGDFVTDSYKILASWRNNFSQLCVCMGLMMLGRQNIQHSH